MSKSDLEKPKCSSCGSINFIYDKEKGETACGDCGMVIEDYQISTKQDWRAFDEIQKAARARAEPTNYKYPDKGLGSKIGDEKFDKYKNRNQEDSYRLLRMKRLQESSRNRDSKAKSRKVANKFIDKIADDIGLTKNVVNTAYLTYKNASDEDVTKGREIKKMAAGALLYSVKQCGLPRSALEIADAAELKESELLKYYNIIINELERKPPPLQKPEWFVNKLCQPGDHAKVTYDILKVVREKRICMGREPIGKATAAAYIAGVLTCVKETQKKLADKSGISEVTIRNICKEFNERMMFTNILHEKKEGKTT